MASTTSAAPGRLRLERPTSLLFLFADKNGSASRTCIGFTGLKDRRPTTWTMTPYKSGSEGRPRPYTILLNRKMNYSLFDLGIQMVGHPGNAPGSLLVPNQAGCLSPSCPLKSGGWRRAFSPNLSRGSTGFQDRVPQRSNFTIH